MINLAVTFLVIALIAFVLGATGVMGFAMNIAFILLAIGVILFIVNALTGRRV